MKNQRSILYGVVTFIVIIAALWGIWTLTTAPANQEAEVVDLQITERDVTKGAVNGPVTLVEYSDLQCPACRAFYPLVKQLVEQNPDTLTLVYRHFPLAQHQNAEPAAYAAEAAGMQGKFFEMHDLLFENQEDWATADNLDELFVSYAEELELDIEQFNADRASDEIIQKVERDLESGISAGVNSTPTFFINGSKIQNPSSFEEFQSLIDEAAAEAGVDAVPADEAGEEATGSAMQEDFDATEGAAMEDAMDSGDAADENSTEDGAEEPAQ